MQQRRSAPASTTSNSRSPQLLIQNRRRSQESGGRGLLSFLGIRRHQGRRERDDGIGEDEDQLLAGIQALQTSGKLAVKTAESQRKAADAFGKWAKGANNNAMADVVGRTGELLELHAEQGTKFAEDYEKSLKQLQKRLEQASKRVKKETKEWGKCMALENQFRRVCRVSDSHELQVKLAAAILEREEAERKLADERMEAEVCRIFGLQEGLKKIADAQWNLAKQMELISACQRELAELVPPISNRDIREMNYTGRSETRQRVAQLRRSLESAQQTQNQLPIDVPPSSGRNRERNPHRQTNPPLPIPHNDSLRNYQQNGQQHRNRAHYSAPPPPPLLFPSQLGFPSPPPPYTPTAPSIELADSVGGTPRAVRNNPNRHSTGANMFLANNGGHSSSSNSSGTTQPNRIYPKLDQPNPFAASQELRRQREEQEERTLAGWLGARQ